MNKIKVVWLCHFSNSNIRSYLPISESLIERILRRIFPTKTNNTDFAQWITNGIREFEKFSDEVELHILAPYKYLKYSQVNFIHNGIVYNFFRSSPPNWVLAFGKKLFNKYNYKYKKNRKIIKNYIRDTQPDIVHVIGAENPYYSLGLLDVPGHIKTILHLQTLLSYPGFQENYFMHIKNYKYRSYVERLLINKANYIGTTVEEFSKTIKNSINNNAKFLPISLAVTEPIAPEESIKLYDFVYFASSIDKAGDWAVEAFNIAYQRCPNITLNIIGGGSLDFIAKLEKRILELGLSSAISFEGRLPTHTDVINQVRKSRYALLPLKVDSISSTIREAMANMLPVITTITDGTPSINLLEECILLSPKMDHHAMAENMIELVNNPIKRKMLIENSLKYCSRIPSNEAKMRELKDTYFSIL